MYRWRNKKLSCRTETARRFVSLNILLSHSRSFEMILLSRVRDHSRSFKLISFESLTAVSYSPSIVSMAVSLTVYKIFSVRVEFDLENYVYLVPFLKYSASKNVVTLKPGIGIAQGH